MDSSKDKYRNPPVPLGYVRKQPEIVLKESNSNNLDGLNLNRLIKLVIESGICEEPDPSIYDKFTINSSSDEEVIEVPVESCPKKVEVIDVEDEVVPDSQDILVEVKKEVSACNLPTTSNASEDLEKAIKPSTSHEKVSVKTEPGSEESKRISLDEEPKKDDEGRRGSQKVKERKDSFSDNDSSSYSKSNRKHKKKKDCDSSDDSRRRSRNKKRISLDSDSGSHSRSQQKKSHDSDSDSYSRSSRHRKDYTSSKGKGHKRLDSDSDSSYYRRKSKKDSDDSDYSNREADRKLNTRSDYFTDRCHSEEGSVTNIKEENFNPSLYGEYLCEVCKITVNSYATFQSHINGKRHMKNLNAQNAADSLSKASVPVEAVTRCPRPPQGYYRLKIECTAKIQPVIDQTLKIPCPGLDNVIEIHSVAETLYYCSLCQAQCSTNTIISHLKGFKHQLNLLKEYEPVLYQKWSFKQKYQIEQNVINVLRDVEMSKGRGLVRVEKDYRETDRPNVELEMASWRDRPSTSCQGPGEDYSSTYLCYSVPDPSKSGYYCRLCDSHSNSEAMWQSHIVGKRHIANVKKAPGTAPSKSKYIPAASNVRPHLFEILDKENLDNEPIVGLSQVREILKPDIDGVSYNCFLCSACISTLEIVNHLVSRKHREKYLESIRHPELETLKSCHMSETSRESIIAELCSNVLAERGSGFPEVYYAKNAVLRG